MDSEELRKRTKQFGLRVIKIVDTLPSRQSSYGIGHQLLHSGTSVGANHRSACCGRSKPDFISKIGIAIEEADESLYWMEMLVEADILPKDRLAPLMQEANEIIAILTASSKTAKGDISRK